MTSALGRWFQISIVFTILCSLVNTLTYLCCSIPRDSPSASSPHCARIADTVTIFITLLQSQVFLVEVSILLSAESTSPAGLPEHAATTWSLDAVTSFEAAI